MVAAVIVVRLDNAAVAVAAMDVVLIQIIVAHRANFLKRDYSTVTDLLFYQSFFRSAFSVNQDYRF